MPSSVVLTEGVRQSIALTPAQANELGRLGFALAGSSSWWGDPDNDETERKALTLSALYGDQYAVTVANAVGVVGLSDLSLVVQPKIPLEHFSYVISRGLPMTPRTDDAPTSFAPSDNFFDVVARWFVAAAEGLLRFGLARDYSEEAFVGPLLRGRVDLVATMRRWGAGIPLVDSIVDEFDFDTPLNRTIRAAALTLRGSSRTSGDLLPRLGRLVRTLEGVSDLKPGDERASPRRGQSRYDLPLAFARQILSATGPSLEFGEQRGQTFLFSSPALIEEGVRAILRQRLLPVLVRKVGKQLNPSTVRVSPDLVIGDRPYTGDVKYKQVKGGWNRPDLAQAVLFATAFRSPFAVIVAFGDSDVRVPTLQIGDISVAQVIWDISPDVSPAVAEERLMQSVREALPLVA